MSGDIFEAIIKKNITGEAWAWLTEKSSLLSKDANAVQLNTAFTLLPRKTGKKIIQITEEQDKNIKKYCPGFLLRDWTADRLSRVYLLTKLNSRSKENFLRIMQELFKAAEMNELVALYSSLAFLAYPEAWRFQCTEGIRSNIATVLEAIMYENPYPATYLDEPAWNQMVLKAFFTGKDVDRITGLEERSNKTLANILIDYAHERWAAHRRVDPRLWQLIGKFIDAHNFPDVQRLFSEGALTEKKAAALACFESNYAPAKNLLGNTAGLHHAILQKTLTWKSLSEEAKNFYSNQ
ncbi:EboA domain-containing protein [Parafilimonas sp.]|uniref:EboA domain-containing protein n=1 Tax=Parafilimonas sp. TaxID=1969739 RepID=UPI0039E3DD92